MSGASLSAASALVAEAACCAVTATWHGGPDAAIVVKIIEAAVARPEEFVHDAAADLTAVLTTHSPGLDLLPRVLGQWKRFSPNQMQGWALSLGSLRNVEGADAFEQCNTFLVELLTRSAEGKLSATVEVRRNACRALARLYASCKEGRHASTPDIVVVTTAALVESLEDYTTDQRGDVGSWVRAAALHALAPVLLMMPDSQMEACEVARGGMVKQMAERIDSVRFSATTSFIETRTLSPRSDEPLRQFLDDFAAEAKSGDPHHLREAEWILPRIVPLLTRTTYRSLLFLGLLASVGSKDDISVSRSQRKIRTISESTPPASRRQSCSVQLAAGCRTYNVPVANSDPLAHDAARRDHAADIQEPVVEQNLYPICGAWSYAA